MTSLHGGCGWVRGTPGFVISASSYFTKAIKLQKFGEDGDDHGAAAADAELAVEAFEVGVDGVGGDAEVVGDCGLFEVVEDALHDLEFAGREAERPGDVGPFGRG